MSAALIALSVIWLLSPPAARAADLAPIETATMLSGANSTSDWPAATVTESAQGRRLLQVVQPDGSITYTMPSNATVYTSPAGSSLIDILGPLLGVLGLQVNKVTTQPKLGTVVV
ncbi:hypothetical protein MNEG_3759, partial [Monoraphidium neglectum]